MTITKDGWRRLQAAGTSFLAAGDRDSTAPALVCLHGIGGDATSFRAQIDGVAGPRQQVLSWDMPGYGESVPLARMDFASLCARLCAALDELGLSHVVIAGQSIGGMIAQEMAIRHPERVAGLVLIATVPAFGGRDDSFKDRFIAARLKPLDAGKTIAELAESFVTDITGPVAGPEAIASAKASMAAVPEETYRDIIRCLTTFNRRNDIEDFNLPVCLIAGEHDQNAPAKTMASMAAKIKGSEYHEVKGAGHLINLEAGEETNAILRAFYGRLG